MPGVVPGGVIGEPGFVPGGVGGEPGLVGGEPGDVPEGGGAPGVVPDDPGGEAPGVDCANARLAPAMPSARAAIAIGLIIKILLS
jgi:hypothetical protein